MINKNKKDSSQSFARYTQLQLLVIISKLSIYLSLSLYLTHILCLAHSLATTKKFTLQKK